MAAQPLRFCDYFWGSDIMSFAGFETLCARLKHGKRFVQEYEEFLKTRAKIEENYGRELIKLSKQFPVKDEIGTLKTSWESLKFETENLGNTHVTNAKKLTQEHDSVKDFKERQRGERKKIEDSVRKVQQYKKTSYEKEVKAKRGYEKSCKDSDHADETYQKMLSTQKQKQIDDAQKKAEVAKGAVERYDNLYKESLRLLDEARVMWEREMEQCCNTFQESEKERINFMRSSMWKYTNIQSQSLVDADETNENIRKVLEKCDSDADNDMFVRSKQTGTDRPAPIQYENFYDKSLTFDLPTIKQSQSSTSFAGHSQISTPISSFAHRELPDIPATPPLDKRLEVDVTASPLKVETPSYPISSTYALVGAISEAPEKSKTWVVASYDYEAQGDQELTLQAGDLVDVLEQEDDTWWRGRGPKGDEGMFPVDFTEPYNPM